MKRRITCPSPIELERGFWSDDPSLQAHADSCEPCQRELAEMRALAAVGSRIEPSPQSPAQREELRSAILAQTGPSSRDRRPARRSRLAPVALAIAAAAAAAVVWSQRPGPDPIPERRAERRGTVLDHGGAGYLVASTQPDEIVRLVQGSLSIELTELAPGERFRVVTGDAEVETRGAVFDITVQDDRLISVRVLHGAVAVRGASTSVVSAGQTWHLPAPPVAIDVAPVDEAVAERGEPGESGELDRKPRTRRSPRPSSIEPRDAPPPEVVEPGLDAAPAPVAISPARQAFNDGWIAIRAQEFDVAAEAFARAAAPPSDPAVAEDAAYWGAVSLARAGRVDPAIEAFERFLTDHRFSPHTGEARVIVGWLRFDRGDYAEAETHFLGAVGDLSKRVRASAAEGLKAVGGATR